MTHHELPQLPGWPLELEGIEKALLALSYGVHVIGSRSNDGTMNAMLADWVMQVSFKPRLLAVSIVALLIFIAIGAAAAWSLARTLSSLQYGVTMGDAGSWVAVLTALGITTLLASWRPARVAAGADPVSLLRED